MPLTAYFVRHGESQANVDRIFANRIEHQAALTAAGLDQARDLATLLADQSITRVYASPLQRARETAEVIAGRIGAPVSFSDALREYDVGADEGLPYGGEHAWRWERYLAVQGAWHSGDRNARHPGGESLADLERRFVPFIERLAATHDASETLLVVSHGGLYHLMLPLVLANVTPDLVGNHPLGHCEVVAATRDEDAWTCVRWGPVALASGMGPDW